PPGERHAGGPGTAAVEKPPGRRKRENRRHREGLQSLSAIVRVAVGARRGGSCRGIQKSGGNLFRARLVSHRTPALRHAAGVDAGVGNDDHRAVPALVPSAHLDDRRAGGYGRSLTMIAFLSWLLIWLVLWLALLVLL